MSFCKMIELLQNKDKGKIILINSGAFYIARGKDELLLHNILDLKVNCMETEICKVGFPKGSLEKYTKQKREYSNTVKKHKKDKIYRRSKLKHTNYCRNVKKDRIKKNKLENKTLK